MKSLCIFSLITFLACGDLYAQNLKQIRVRISDAITYRDFTYSGRHWLEGIALSLDEETLVIGIDRGVAPVSINIKSITEMQVRTSNFGDWQAVSGPLGDVANIRGALGIQQPASAPMRASNALESQPITVAYIEETGVEILKLHPDVGGTISQPWKSRLGLFAHIENFDSAQYIRNPDGTYGVRIVTFDESGIMHKVLQPVSEAGILSLQKRISRALDAPSDSDHTSSVTSESERPHTPSATSSTRRNGSSKDELFVYLAGAYHFVPNSEFSDNMELILGIDLANTNIDGGSLGVMYRVNSRTYADIALVRYGTRDRTVEFGEIIDFSYAVRSIEVAVHRRLIDNFTTFTSVGIASVKDKRRIGSLVDIEDDVTTWPFSLGARWMPFGMRSRSIRWLVEARYRWTSLTYTDATTGEKSGFELGGLFLQFALVYKR